MNKLQSLRDFIESQFEWLQQNPTALSVFVVDGQFGGTLTAPIALTYAYTARLILIDFVGDLREVTAAIEAWIHQHQPDLAQNPARRSLVRFEVEQLANNRSDVQIDIPLTESAQFTPREGGGYQVIDVQEALHEVPYTDAAWQVNIDGDPIIPG